MLQKVETLLCRIEIRLIDFYVQLVNYKYIIRINIMDKKCGNFEVFGCLISFKK